MRLGSHCVPGINASDRVRSEPHRTPSNGEGVRSGSLPAGRAAEARRVDGGGSGADGCERVGLGRHCFPGNIASDRVGPEPHCAPVNGGGVRSGADGCERVGLGRHCYPGNIASYLLGPEPHSATFNGGGVRSGAVECEGVGLGPHCFPGNFASDRVGSKPHRTPFNSGGAVFHAAAPVVSPPPARWNSEASSRRSQQSPGQGPSCTGRGRGGEVANHCPPQRNSTSPRL